MGHPRLCGLTQRETEIPFGFAQGRLSLGFTKLGCFVESCAYLLYVRSMGSNGFVQLIAGHSELATPVSYV